MNQDQVNEIRDEVNASLDRIAQHPFIKDGRAQRLSKAQCLRWVMCAGRESRTFPEVLRNMMTLVEDQKVMDILRENLQDELGHGNPEQAHFRHYVHLIQKLGLTEADFENYPERAGIRLAVDLGRSISLHSDPAVSLGYMLVNEGIVPITYGAVDVAIQKHFPELTTNFFNMHVLVDEEHVRQLFVAVGEMQDTDASAILFGLALGERGVAVLLDEALGLYEATQREATPAAA